MTLLDYIHEQNYRRRQKLKIWGYMAVACLILSYLGAHLLAAGFMGRI
jgi:hypothetical protein